MKMFFILGRNPFLSRIEILSYLTTRQRNFKEILFEENFLLLDLPDDERIDIQNFGGIIKLGKIEYFGTQKGFVEFIQKDELIPSDKFTYAIYGNESGEILKEKFKQDHKKAIQKYGKRILKLQDGNKKSLPKSDFSIFIFKKESNLYYGRVTQEYDSKSLEFRDMNKPVRRQELAISPRLSKILINLSEAKVGTLLLDPFCGVGGILQEALILGIKCTGYDKDPKAIEDARKNLEWINKQYTLKTPYTLESLDSRKTPDLQFGAIATETPLGTVLRRKPNPSVAKSIIAGFEGFIIPILQRLKKCKKPKAKIAITFPIVTGIVVNLKKVSDKTGLKVTSGPFIESRVDQYISRQIVVFE